jgi:hypothetical protein
MSAVALLMSTGAEAAVLAAIAVALGGVLFAVMRRRLRLQQVVEADAEDREAS